MFHEKFKNIFCYKNIIIKYILLFYYYLKVNKITITIYTKFHFIICSHYLVFFSFSFK